MSGLYDLATPADAAEYTFERMMLHPSQRARVETTTYEAGHMMYLHEPSLVKMGEDISRFLSAPLQQPLEVTVPR
jgi:carboxypeptidase C (cathepsin A)